MRPLPNLDLMRAIAVCLVIIDHTALALRHPVVGTWQLGWLGVFGVYLFFVHTTLVLMWSLHRQPHVLNFYIRRAFRIYPLAVTVIAIAFFFKIPLAGGSPDIFVHRHFTARDLVSNLLLAQNVFRSAAIVGLTWSLTLEVQMYVVLPALFLYAYREKKIWQLLLLWALSVVTVAPFTQSTGNSLSTVTPDFLCGVIAYVAFDKYKPRLAAWTFVPALAVLTTIYMCKPGVRMSWPITLALGLMLPLFRQITQSALVRASHLVAKYSYGIYLGHPFGIFVGFDVLAGHRLWLQISSELLLTAVLAVAGYHLIEEPLIRLGGRIARANDARDPAPLARADPADPRPVNTPA